VIKKYRVTLILVLAAIIGMPLAAYYTHMKYRHKLMEETARHCFVIFNGVGECGIHTLLKQENGDLYELSYYRAYPEGTGGSHEQRWQGRLNSLYTFSHKGKMYAAAYFSTDMEKTSYIAVFTEDGDVCKSLMYSDSPEYWRIENNKLVVFNYERFPDPNATRYIDPYIRKSELMNLDTLEDGTVFMMYNVENGKSELIKDPY